LILVPKFAYSLSVIEKRPPLAPTAQRAGWVGCNILLCNIPADARIPIVHAGIVADPRRVRKQYSRLRPLEALKLSERGWTLDVLNVIRKLKKAHFTLQEVYAHAPELSHLHPDNKHVRDKVRQQLQVLRDKGFLEFSGRGHYRI
jgi:type II restriction enzyme